MIKATVIIPTTKYRAPLLPYSVGSVLMQTEPDIEVFIVGDGVDEETRQVIAQLKLKDDRIQFFDHPKGKRRGELYRNEALQNHATGKVVCYLLDRDLMLPDHVEKMIGNLQDHHNFCVSTCINVDEQHRLTILRKRVGENLVPGSSEFIHHASFRFSSTAHTLSLYRSLPHGWRTTPANMATDRYMWLQMVDHPNCLVRSIPDLTILYFKRGNHPGLAAEQRAKELAKFYPRISSTREIESMKKEALSNLINDYDSVRRQWLLIKGHSPFKIPRRIWEEILSNFARKQ